MGFFSSTFLGVRLWIWLYLAIGFFSFMGVMIYFYREKIRKKYYELRFSEKLLKVVIHYPSNLYKVYWRLIPEHDKFEIAGKIYYYSDKEVYKVNDFFSRKEEDIQKIYVDGKWYNIIDELKIKHKGKKYAEIHYLYDVPKPLNFDLDKSQVEFSGVQLEQFKENDMFSKLLQLDENKPMIILILVICGANLLATIFIIAKMMGWIQ